MNDEQRFRIYRDINRRIMWERRAALSLTWVSGLMAGFGVGLLIASRMD